MSMMLTKSDEAVARLLRLKHALLLHHQYLRSHHLEVGLTTSTLTRLPTHQRAHLRRCRSGLVGTARQRVTEMLVVVSLDLRHTRSTADGDSHVVTNSWWEHEWGVRSSPFHNLEFPKFDDTNPWLWCDHCDMYFEVSSIKTMLKTRFAALNFTDPTTV